ncbi:MAG: hypothetical protein GY708_04075 [Actinomycetia bacterium]|nr:hypothetical protein [Actinomycetes bacterium]MCP4962357.1 hypothetical protein [Actinomycetes bacterium]
MKVIGLTYATSDFAPYAALLAASSRKAGVDEFTVYTPADIDPEFRHQHRQILDAQRGAGYWLWKPLLIAQTLRVALEGDLVLWVDAAAHFAGPVNGIVEAIDRAGLDILLMGEGFTESAFTKRDTFIGLDADEPAITDSPQRFASCIAVRNTASSREFIDRYLAACSDPRLITDAANVMGADNYADFRDHRHDQSILSILSKQARIPVIPNGLVAEGLSPPGSQVINHTRRHVSATQVLTHLLAHGLATTEDLAAMRLQ